MALDIWATSRKKSYVSNERKARLKIEGLEEIKKL